MHLDKGAKAVHYESGPDMTPLVDVVMVLLIFLMMAGKFGGGIKYLISDMPISGQATAPAPPDPTKPPTQDIVLNVLSPTVDTFRAFYGRTVNAQNEEELASQLKALLDEKIAAGTKVEEVQLYIKPTRNVIYSNIIRVYTAAGRAGFTKIGFQTADG